MRACSPQRIAVGRQAEQGDGRGNSAATTRTDLFKICFKAEGRQEAFSIIRSSDHDFVAFDRL